MKIGLVQMRCSVDTDDNVAKATRLIEDASKKGAEVVCLQELFNTIYFAFEQDPKHFDWAEPIPGGPTSRVMSAVAQKNGVALVAPMFERDTVVPGLFYNTTAVFDGKGKYLGKYRKTSLPQLPGYMEKFYFAPGNLGYPVFEIGERGPKIGTVTCYDRHFLEGPRIEALKGAQIIFIPTCTYFYPELWELELRAHASFNTVFVAGVNRCGAEYPEQSHAYYGTSMVVDPTGEIIAKAGANDEALVVDISLGKLEERRRMAPFLRDRRPELYGEISEPSRL
jgi:beta-ureidopropionase